jgi:hypothetical protein
MFVGLWTFRVLIPAINGFEISGSAKGFEISVSAADISGFDISGSATVLLVS